VIDQAHRGRPRALAAILAAVLLAGVVPATPTAGATESPQPAAPASSELPVGGKLVMSFESDFATLDPAIGWDQVSTAGEILMFENLIEFNNPQEMKLVPRLAEAMPELSADGKTYTFKLRPGISFVRPDGSILKELTAEDVVFTLNRLIDPDLTPAPSPTSSYWINIEGAQDVVDGKAEVATGIKAIDPYTVSITLVEPDPVLLMSLTIPNAAIIPAGSPSDTTVQSANPIGTGPFLLKEHVTGQRAVFVRNPHYWQAGKPYLDEIEIDLAVDGNAGLQQVQTGALDFLGDGIPLDSLNQVLNDPAYAEQVRKQILGSTRFLYLDTNAPEGTPGAQLRDTRVRQAIAHAIDKSALVKIHKGTVVEAACVYPPTIPGFDPACDPYPFDVEKAKQLLAEAGYPDGLPEPLTLAVSSAGTGEEVAQSIQQDLAQIGIEVEIQSLAQDVFYGVVLPPNHEVDMAYDQWTIDYPHPSIFIEPLFGCAATESGGWNYAKYCNAEVDTAAAAARVEPDFDKSMALYGEVQKALMADAPAVPLVHGSAYTLTSERLQGYSDMKTYFYDMRDFAVGNP
jgi:ABC-type transport system substrate-binding protein